MSQPTYVPTDGRSYRPTYPYLPPHTKAKTDAALLNLIEVNALRGAAAGEHEPAAGEPEPGEEEEEITPAEEGELAAGEAPAAASAPQGVASAWASP